MRPRYLTQWGSWAGKLICGAESLLTPEIFTVDEGGCAAKFEFDIKSEDFDLIPAGWDLYCVDNRNHRIVKSPHTLFDAYAGSLLITQEPVSFGDSYYASLFVFKWDAAKNDWDIRRVRYISGLQGDSDQLEHVSFAPFSLSTERQTP